MSTTTRNEAAERLRAGLAGWSGLPFPQDLLDEALAAERAEGYAEGSRATVESLRLELADRVKWYSGYVPISAIEAALDEEAANAEGTARSPEGSKP